MSDVATAAVHGPASFTFVEERRFPGVLNSRATGLLISVTCLAALDGINGALSSTLRPYLTGSFSATPDEITWGAILYNTSKLFALLMAARLRERIGERRALLGASTLLILAMAAPIFITSYAALLIVQTLQGAGGGLIIALGQAALLTTFTRRNQPLVQAVFALAVVMFPATIAPALLGGFAYDSNWRQVYVWMTLLAAPACVWIFWRREHLSSATVSLTVPVVRIILLLTFLFCLVFELQQGNRHAWLQSPYVIGAGLLGLLCLLGLAFAETDGRPTYLRYSCFRYSDFTFGVLISLAAGVALSGSGNIIPGFLAGVLGYPVRHSGQAQLYAAGFATFTLLAVGLTVRFTKFPPFLFIVFGLILLGTSLWKLGELPSDTDFAGLLFWLAMRGFALGCLFLPLTLATLTRVPPADAAAASGLFNFGRQLGGLVGIAWMQTLQEHLVNRNLALFGETLSPSSPNFSSYLASVQEQLAVHGAQLLQLPATATAITLQEAQQQVATVAFNGCFQSLAMFFVFVVPVAVSIRVLTIRLLKPGV